MAEKELRRIRIHGNIAYVPLSQEYEAVIDAADVPLVEAWNWQANATGNTMYAARSEKRGSKTTVFLMHRVILGAKPGTKVDHVNRDGLNNRRSNLRLATHTENMRNSRIQKNNTSGFKGVSRYGDTGRWRACIWADGVKTSLGCFDTPEEAHAAYCEAAKRLHGKFWRAA